MSRHEEWRDIIGYKGLYQVSNLANVKSLGRDRLLKLTEINKYGHKIAQLWKNNKKQNILVHRLVLEVFVGPCPDGMECCHGSNGVIDNSLENICWGTRKKNQGEDRLRDGTDNRGKKNGISKLIDSDVLEIRDMLSDGISQRVIGNQFGVSKGCISHIKNGETWGWLK
jgi:hypothetical protein